jgi:hypothetical protein
MISSPVPFAHETLFGKRDFALFVARDVQSDTRRKLDGRVKQTSQGFLCSEEEVGSLFLEEVLGLSSKT